MSPSSGHRPSSETAQAFHNPKAGVKQLVIGIGTEAMGLVACIEEKCNVEILE